MKKILIFTLIFLITAPLLCAQTTQAKQAADPSAALEVRSKNQGFLPPRMNTFARNQIQDPAVGLTIYNTNLQALETHVGSGKWLKLGAASSSLADLFDKDKDTGIYTEKNAQENTLRFQTAGTERMTINENGNVGIGNSNPDDRLDVTGTVHISGALKDSSGDTGTDGQLLSSTAAGTNWVTPFELLDGDGNTSIYLSDTNTSEDIIRFKTAGTERMTINENGNIGIGTLTPDDALDVTGTVHISGALKDSSGDTGTDGQLLSSTAAGTNWGTPTPPSELLDGDGNTSIYLSDTNTSEDIIRFKTVGTERMTIIKNGNIGIGTLTPDDVLDVTGTVHISGALKDSSGDTGTDGQLLKTTGTGIDWVTPTPPSELYDKDGNTKISTEVNSNGEDILRFDTAGTERMHISAAGNIGIGNTNPNDVLDVAGTVHISGALKDSSGDTGADGQILSSTANGTNWVDVSVTSTQAVSILPGGPSDGDTYFDTSDNTLNIFNNGSWSVFSRASTKAGVVVVHNSLGYGEITSAGTGEIWLDRNMGATKAPASIGDTGSRIATEFGRFYTFADAQTACPPGYRLPTKAEWDAEVAQFANHGGQDHKGAWGSLKLTMTGYRSGSEALGVYYVASSGNYWSGEADTNTVAWSVAFSSSRAIMLRDGKSLGFAVRCMKDD